LELAPCSLASCGPAGPPRRTMLGPLGHAQRLLLAPAALPRLSNYEHAAPAPVRSSPSWQPTAEPEWFRVRAQASIQKGRVLTKILPDSSLPLLPLLYPAYCHRARCKGLHFDWTAAARPHPVAGRWKFPSCLQRATGPLGGCCLYGQKGNAKPAACHHIYPIFLGILCPTKPPTQVLVGLFTHHQVSCSKRNLFPPRNRKPYFYRLKTYPNPTSYVT
jgi:hypothetical protein